MKTGEKHMVQGIDESEGVPETNIRAKTKKLRWIVIAAAAIACAGIFADVLLKQSGPIVPLDMSNPEGVIVQWEASGFLKSLDVTAAGAIVDDVIWRKANTGEKNAIVMLLEEYLRKKSSTAAPRMLVVTGFTSHQTLAAMEGNGVRLQQ